MVIRAVADRLRPNGRRGDGRSLPREPKSATIWRGLMAHSSPSRSLIAPLAGADRFFPADLLEAEPGANFDRSFRSFSAYRSWRATADTVMPFFFRLLHQCGGYLCRVGRVGASDREIRSCSSEGAHQP